MKMTCQDLSGPVSSLPLQPIKRSALDHVGMAVTPSRQVMSMLAAFDSGGDAMGSSMSTLSQGGMSGGGGGVASFTRMNINTSAGSAVMQRPQRLENQARPSLEVGNSNELPPPAARPLSEIASRGVLAYEDVVATPASEGDSSSAIPRLPPQV